MNEPEKPLVMFSGTQRLLKMMTENGKSGAAFKLVGWLLSVALLIFVAVTHDWIGVTKQGAVDTNRIDHVERVLVEAQAALPHDYFRKDIADVRLGSIDRRLDRIEEQQTQIQTTLDRVLIELQRKR